MRHKHTLSHYKLLTGDMGRLYPVGLIEVLPKDTFQHSSSLFLRFSPMAAPVMHPVTVRMHHFFVPHRLVWPESEGGGWEQFITSGPDGEDSQEVPVIPTTGTAADLYDYYGLPQQSGLDVSALPVRGFNLIFNEWFRDQDLIDKRLEDDTAVPLVSWQKDYLTTARPWPQKGPAITLPLGTRAPITGLGANTGTYADPSGQSLETGGNTVTYVDSQKADEPGNTLRWEEDPDNPGFPNIYADLSSSEAVPINEFRKAFALQRYAEARARYGSRYTEYLKYLGCNPRDSRLQRPEYLAGGKARVNTSEVLQTSDDQGGQADRFGIGDMYGHGVAAMRSNAYRRTFDEHGYVHTMVSVRPKAIYTNGAERHWLRRFRDDFWQRELQHIGQQEVWDGEVFVDASPTDTETYNTFGYADRYREYREQQSRIAGEFRGPLDYWHLARDFASQPVLNQSFIDCDPSKRIFNVQDQDVLWMAVQHRLVARRLVSRNAAGRIL